MEGCIERTHVKDGKKITEFIKDGQIVAKRIITKLFCGFEEIWYCNGEQQRENGPAVIYYDEKYNKTSEFWLRAGKLHRNSGPALIRYGKNGNKTHSHWYRHDELCHTGVLAAIICYDIDLANKAYVDGFGFMDNIDRFRDAVKGDAIHQALRALPIPVRDAIAWHYCYQ